MLESCCLLNIDRVLGGERGRRLRVVDGGLTGLTVRRGYLLRLLDLSVEGLYLDFGAEALQVWRSQVEHFIFECLR